MGGGNTRCDNLLARLVGVGGGAEPHQRFICDAPPGAGGRRRGRQVGPKAGSGERSGADGSQWVNTLANLCGKGGGAQVRRRSRVRRRCGTWVPLGWGVERPEATRTGSNWGRVVGDSSPSKEKEAKKSAGSFRREELDGMRRPIPRSRISI